MKAFFISLALALFATPTLANNCSTYPYILTNGTTADANQVMANFNNILSCANFSLAHNGANFDITSLSGLTTPLSIAQGGTGNTAGQPSGAAGGQLTGFYPSPSLATGAALTNLGFTPLNSAGATATGSLGSAASLFVQGLAGTSRALTLQTGLLNRWAMLANGTAETGSNAGSDFFIGRYNDSGVSIDNPFQILRSTGQVAITDGLNVTGDLNVTGGITGSISGGTVAGSTGTFSSAIDATTIIGDHGVRIRADGTNAGAILQFTNNAGGAQWGALTATNGALTWTGSFSPASYLNLPAATTSTAGVAQLQTVAQFRNQQTSGTGSGETLTATTWDQRTLNTTVTNNISGASLSSNQFTLPAGTYRIDVTAPAYAAGVGGVKSRLRNITDASTVGLSANDYVNGNGSTIVKAVVTIAGAKVFEIDTYPGGSGYTGGQAASSGEAEVYTDVLITKIG